MAKNMGSKQAAGTSDLEYLTEILSFVTEDSEGIALRLLKKYTSVRDVFIALPSDLMKIKGVDENTATYITRFPSFCRTYYNEFYNPKLRVFNSESAYHSMKGKFYGYKNEVVGILILNSHGYVLFNEIICSGSVNLVPIYIKDIVRLCLEYNADTVIVGHNHPSGNPLPSENDLITTREIQLALESIYVTLYDHIVFTETDYTSMRMSGWLQSISDAADEFRRKVLDC